MKQITLTRGMFAIVDDADFDTLQKYNWQMHKHGYATRKKGLGHISMHREIMNPPSGFDVDHINGNKLDNRRANLRICSRHENTFNQGLRSNNNSGYKGVSWRKQERKWIAQIQANGKRKTIGYFDSAIEAARAYDNAAIEAYGEYARLNFK